MKSIDTLVEDIYSVLETDVHKVSEENVEWFANSLASLIKGRLETKREGGKLRLSNLGTQCERKLYYEVNSPEKSEPIPGKTQLKFIYGDIMELLLLFLAKEAGHSVVDTQKEVELEGVPGHIDAIIDGCLVDVKSASTMSFKKFQSHKLLEDDPFGYLTQQASYLDASNTNENLINKNEVHFLAIDKQFGDLCLDRYWREQLKPVSVKHARDCVSSSSLPKRSFKPIPDGKSGNERLGTYCSYCSYKWECYPQLREFVYSTGPRYLTNVIREPDVHEIKRVLT